ncbi:NADPH oxidase activator 1 isoform X6 [Syngnathus typhle]|uniref:NADPH oxidase activator 1 isoform X6 n=1 Tax=Syngnathus typhle TaxID=161592 RepID=UPI002A69C6F9|nr:NADPH oxidase activator 1 isoform X6 [Syngnathus typhle]
MEENYKAARNFNSKVSASHQKKITKQQDILIQSQLFTPEAKMLYTELLQLWNESVHAMDNKDWQGALEKLDQITEPTYRTLFNAASAHICLGQLDAALMALDLTIVKDQHLAVAFFQRAAVMMQLDRLDEALSDCVWAQTHLRGNMVIDYRQLGLRYKLYSWQVLHNAAAVYCRMDQWDQARDILISQTQGGNLEMALDSVLRKETLAPLNVPEGVVFRPRKKDVEQLKQRDFLGKSKVISSMIPNDDFGGFEPLRLQKPGYYQPIVDGAKECRYMCMTVPYMARGPGHLTVPGGSKIFLYEDQDKDGMATVIYDGQRGLVPMSLLKPADIKMTTSKTESEDSFLQKHHLHPTQLLPILNCQPQTLLSTQPVQPVVKHRKHGSRVLVPLEWELEPGRTIQEFSESGKTTLWCQAEDSLRNHTILYQMVALYDYAAQGQEDLEFSEGDTIDILCEVNDEWLEGHCAGRIGIFPSSFAMRENEIL